MIKIAFCSDRTDALQLYIMDEDGANLTRLTNDSANYYYPRFSPDGERILFYSGGGGDDEIFIINTDGTELRNLTNMPGNDNSCRFSPDGSQIIFTSERDGNREIYIMDRDGKNQQRLTDNTWEDRGPQFSPDGTKIAFYGINVDTNSSGDVDNGGLSADDYYDIFTINPDVNHLNRLTRSGDYRYKRSFTPDYSQTSNDAAPYFSPDGSQIVFMSLFGHHSFDIHLITDNDSHAQRLTYNGAMAPCFSPDGRQIVFRTHRNYNYDIYTMNTDGSDQVNLTPNSQNVFFCQFSSDGSRMLLNEDDRLGINYRIYLMNSDGSNKIKIETGELRFNDYFPCLQP